MENLLDIILDIILGAFPGIIHITLFHGYTEPSRILSSKSRGHRTEQTKLMMQIISSELIKICSMH